MPTFTRRAVVSISLSIFFLVVYGLTSFVAASVRHAPIPSFYFSWEHRIPFVAAMIMPYLSSDVFFVVAPLLARSERELRTYALRIIVTISVAGAVFLIMPLKFAFERPAERGFFGVITGQFFRADAPVNELPSLHIALLLVVGEMFVRHTRGKTRCAFVCWFILIAASPLFVHQHHLVDLIAGFALGLLSIQFIRQERRVAFEPSWRIGGYYLAAALAFLSISFWIGREAWPVWWPTMTFLIVAVGYWWIGPSVYGKRDGQLNIVSRSLFWPAIIGQHVSLRWYARRCRSRDVLTDRVWIGRHLSESEAIAAREAGVGAVIDLTCEFAEPKTFRAIPYLHLPTLDLTAPTSLQIEEAVRFIKEHAERTTVYIHCKAGYSRTAVIAAAYLLASGRADSAADAILQVRRARLSIIIRPEALRAIENFAIASVSKST